MSPMTMRCVPNPFLLVVVAVLKLRELLFPKPPKPKLLLMKALLFKEEKEDKEAAFVVKVVAWRISFCASSQPFTQSERTKKTFRVSKPNKIETFVVRFLSLSSVLS